MTMGFEFETFPGKGRGFASKASIRKSGQIGFNNGAVMHHEMTKFDGAILHYDRKNRIIGVELLSGSDDARILTLIHRPGNSYIAAKSFLEWFEIPVAEETERYDLWKDDATGFLIIELGKPLPKKSEQERSEKQLIQT